MCLEGGAVGLAGGLRGKGTGSLPELSMAAVSPPVKWGPEQTCSGPRSPVYMCFVNLTPTHTGTRVCGHKAGSHGGQPAASTGPGVR